jgi:hypothetical protein
MASPDDGTDEETSSDTVARGTPFAPKEGADVTGDLERTSLEEVLTQVFCARSTGTLTVEKAGREPEGELVIWKGEVLAASVGKLTGDPAAIALLRRKVGGFRFTEELEPREQNVTRTIPDLVEASKLGG